MRINAKSLLTLLLLTIFTFSLAACNEPEVSITDVSFDQTVLEASYEISEFNIEDFFLTVTFSDGSTEQIVISEEMISSSDLAKLNVTGTHTVEIFYQGYRLSITINLSELSINKLNLLLLNIFNTSVAEGTIIDMTYEEWLESIRGEQGLPGADGKEVLFQVAEGYIQWQYTGDTTWTNLVSLSTLTGADGSDGTNGEDGVDGKEVLFQVAEGYIQWQYTGDIEWKNLVSLSTLVGPAGLDGIDGKQVTFQVSEGFIKWQYVGDETWTNLIDLATLTGTDGESAYDIYIKYHPNYIGTEEQWIDDLVNGLLGDQYIVSFDSSGGTSISPQTVYAGNKVTKPIDPTKDGYTFVGWYYQDEPWVFVGYPVSADIILEAKYTINDFDITYYLNGGSFGEVNVPTSYTIETETFTIFEPTKEGYIFAGWTYDGQDTLIKNFTINQGSIGDYILHANWWGLEESVVVTGGLPTIGNPKIVVILVHWLDGGIINVNYNELQSRFFSDAYYTTTSTGLDSVNSFLYRSSYGKVNLTGNVYEYTTTKNNAQYSNFNEIANEVIDYFEHEISWDDYDSNNDGYVDGFYIVFENYPNYGGPNFVSTFDRNVGTKNITQICSISSPDVGTMVHETIHMFGPPDIYAAVGVNPAGSMASSVMDQGFGDIPGIMKYVLGWIDHPVYIDSNDLQTINLDSLSTNGNIVIVYPNADSNNKNWFIIEYITPEMNNFNYWVETNGGLRIWRSNMYVDDNGNIIGIETADHGFMPSPYEYLEAVNDGEYNYFFYAGDEFTPYSYLSSYYGASLVWNGNSKELVDITFSGIYIDNITIDGTKASFDIRIEETPQIMDIVIDNEFNSTIEKGNFINDTDFSMGELNFNIEVMLSNESSFTFTNEFGELILVNLVIDKTYRKIKLIVSPESIEQISLNQIYSIGIPEGMLQTYYGTAIDIPTYFVSFNEIPVHLNASEEILFQYNSSFWYDMPKLFETGDTQVTYFSFNDINDSLIKLVNLNILDTISNVIITYSLDNQLDTIIDPVNNYIVGYDVFMLDNGNFVTSITLNLYETYYDYYNSSGELIGSFINDRRGNGDAELLYIERNTMYLHTNTLVVDSHIARIEFGESIEILSSGIDKSLTNLFLNSQYKIIRTNDAGYVFFAPGDGFQYEAYYYDIFGGITLLDNTLELNNQRFTSVYNDLLNIGLFFGIANKKLVAYWFNIDTGVLEEEIILTDLAIKESLTNDMFVEYNNGTYLIYFNSVAEDNSINYQTSYILLLDDNLDIQGYYRHGDSTYRYVMVPTIISQNRTIASTTYDNYNFLFFYLST